MVVVNSKILVTDDEPRICKSLSFFLEKQGLQVTVANSGIEALELMADEKYDLFLIDKQMPEMDGFQLMDFIMDKEPDTPVIMMTGNASIDSAIHALKKGAYDYLRKPFEYEELIKTVKNALNHKKLKDENLAIAGRLDMSEKRYQAMVQNSPDFIYTLDQNENIVFVNSAFERLLGYRTEDIVGRSFFDIVLEEDHDVARWVFNDRRMGKRSEVGIELRMKCSPTFESRKKFLTVEMKSSVVSAEDGNGFEGVYVVARDVSYRKELENQLRQAQKMEAIGTLAGGIAHDFNNLLMSIQGYTSIIMASMDTAHPHMKKLAAIEKHVRSGSDLTRQLLGFARGGKYDVRPTNINILLRDTATMFGRTKKEIQIHLDLEKKIWPVEVDEGQIEQVLLNLYVNAWQAMPYGGDIFLKTENVVLEKKDADEIGQKPGNYIKISVTDTGCGMDEETQKRIFDPFFTTKDRSCGTGLGLASAYGIIDSHKGALKVSSKPDKGSTFTIYLFSSKKKPVEKKEVPKQVMNGKETVLIVDDESHVLEVTQDMLEDMGYSVMTASSGKDAVRIYMENSQSIDLVILDMIMPGIGGGETFDYIRKINPDARIILSSGYSLQGEAEDILKRGCNGFIQKPYSMVQISQKIYDVLGHKMAV